MDAGCIYFKLLISRRQQNNFFFSSSHFHRNYKQSRHFHPFMPCGSLQWRIIYHQCWFRLWMLSFFHLLQFFFTSDNFLIICCCVSDMSQVLLYVMKIPFWCFSRYLGELFESDMEIWWKDWWVLCILSELKGGFSLEKI